MRVCVHVCVCVCMCDVCVSSTSRCPVVEPPVEEAPLLSSDMQISPLNTDYTTVHLKGPTNAPRPMSLRALFGKNEHRRGSSVSLSVGLGSWC